MPDVCFLTSKFITDLVTLCCIEKFYALVMMLGTHQPLVEMLARASSLIPKMARSDGSFYFRAISTTATTGSKLWK
jgi:hypothetical protein